MNQHWLFRASRYLFVIFGRYKMRIAVCYVSIHMVDLVDSTISFLKLKLNKLIVLNGVLGKA